MAAPPQCRRHAALVAVAASCTVSERLFGSGNADRRIACTRCEQARHSLHPPLEDLSPPPTITWWNKTLATVYLSSLPLPRTLLPNDPAFSDSALRRGIRQRLVDEAKLRELQHRIEEVQGTPRAQEEMQKIFAQVTEVAYGKGVTPQEREDFLAVGFLVNT